MIYMAGVLAGNHASTEIIKIRDTFFFLGMVCFKNYILGWNALEITFWLTVTWDTLKITFWLNFTKLNFFYQVH